MGAFLEKPIVDKAVHGGVLADGSAYCVCSMQGWRMHMEDAHCAVTQIPGLQGAAFFAVFDGHGGKTVSIAAGNQALQAVVSTKEFQESKTADSLGSALRAGLFVLDENIKESHPEFKEGHDRSGSTALTSFITETHIIFCNCGDSRAILVSGNAVKFGTEDHKPSSTVEKQRIEAAGGFIEMGRVCGNLAVSRSLGDYEYKDRPDLPREQQKVSAEADVTVIPRDAGDEFVILACDGIWDVVSNEGAQVFVNFYLERGRQAEEISRLLLDFCLDLGSRDNMSVIIILLPAHRRPDPSKQKPAPTNEEEQVAFETAEKKELKAAVMSVPGIQKAVLPPPPTTTKAVPSADAPVARRSSESD